MAGFVARWLLTAGLLLALPVEAGDPTRPPEAWLSSSAPAGAGTPGEDGLRLQSVLLPQHGRGRAVISGAVVAVGGRLGDMVLMRVSEQEAVLHGPEGVLRLFLTPEVDKQMISVAPESAIRRRKSREAR